MNREQAAALCNVLGALDDHAFHTLRDTKALNPNILANYNTGNIQAYADGAAITLAGTGETLDDPSFNNLPQYYRVVKTKLQFNVEKAMAEGAWGREFLFTRAGETGTSKLGGVTSGNPHTFRFITGSGVGYDTIAPVSGETYPEGWFERVPV